MTFASTARPLLYLFAVALWNLSGTAAAVEPPATPASAPRSAGFLTQVTTLIGDAECDNQSQCHAVGVGAKACGGPAGYLAWSEKKTDPNALRTAGGSTVASADRREQDQRPRLELHGHADAYRRLPPARS